MPKMITLLLFAAIETLVVGLGSAQNASRDLKPENRWVFRETATPPTHSNQVCFSTCKYQGATRPYFGVSDKDDENCSVACGKAEQKCRNNNDGPCQYVSGSCKYTNCN